MVVTLNRNKIFIIGLTIITSFLFLNRLDYIFGSDVTTGEVVRIKNPYGRYSAPIIKFSTAKYDITFQGVTNMDLDIGEKVDVIYNISKPINAEVFSFVGFWLTPILYCIIPIMLLFSVTFSFLTSSQTIVLDLKKIFKKRADGNTQIIERNNKPKLKN